MSKMFSEELTVFSQMSEQKQKELVNEKQSVCGQTLIATNEDSEEVDSLKQENKKLKSQIQTLRAQNELLKAHECCDTTLPLQQNKYKSDSISNKRICLRSYEPKKWSFSERICDDLSEVILQFLPIEDKFRFECVSKQFQRTVYRTHDLVYRYKMCPINVKTFLKKLSNIKSLKIFGIIGPENNSIINLIIKNCNQLTEFEGSLNGITEKTKQLFGEIFGPKLTSLKIWDSSYDSIISSFVNIRDIDLHHYYEMSDEFYTKIRAKNLKKLSTTLWIYSNNNYNNDFKRFIDNNKSITHLSISFGYSYAFGFVLLEPIDPNLRMFSQLNQLTSLRLKGYFELKSLTNGLKQLALNCRKLKELRLEFNEITKDFKTNDFMSEMKKFKELKRMEIYVWNNCNENYIEFEEYFQNSLKTGFKDLTHLMIYFSFYEFNETFIENIYNYLPNLQNLILNRIKSTEKTADILSPLSRLETLKLNITDKSLIDLLKNKIIKNCRKIKSIEL